MDPEKQARERLELMFSATLKDQVARYLRVRPHTIIPYHHFTPGAVECRDMFVAGHYYGCISLAQAVAEALSRFIAITSKRRPGKDPAKRFADLRNRGIISQEVRRAFESIWSDDRNDYHHLNPKVETDRSKLEARAEVCLTALKVIDSEIFAFTTNKGAIVPAKPQYWPNTNSGKVEAYVDFE